MSEQLFTLPRVIVFDSNAALVSGAKANFYIAGTLTRQNTFTDSALTTPHANPVVADANGVLAPIYLDAVLNYKVDITDTLDVSLSGYPIDNLTAALTATEIGTALYSITTAETAAGVTPTNIQYEPGDVRRYGSDGVDDYEAFRLAILANRHVIAPWTGNGYVIDTTLCLTRYQQIIEIFDDVTYTGAAATALFKVDGGSELEVSCHRSVTGNDNNYCTHFENGTSVTFRFNKTVGFLIHHAYIQAGGGKAAGHSCVESRIWYNLMSGFNAAGSASVTNGQGILFRNTTGDDTVAFEGAEFHGGFIWRFNGHCIHVENNVNARYMQVTGALDSITGGGQDYTVDAGSQQTSASLYLKWISQSRTTLGDGDILFNGKRNKIQINSERASISIDLKNITGVTLTAPSVQLIGAIKGGVTEATRYLNVLSGTDEGLTNTEDVFLGAYYDPGTSTPPVAADAKLTGLMAAFRRNDDASAIEGGNLEFQKRAGVNTVDLEVQLNNAGTKTAKFFVKAEGGIGISNSAVNVATPSGVTARDLEIFDETGSSLGFIPIYAARWT